MYSAQLIGCIVRVLDSTEASWLGLCGVVVDQTQNTLLLARSTSVDLSDSVKVVGSDAQLGGVILPVDLVRIVRCHCVLAIKLPQKAPHSTDKSNQQQHSSENKASDGSYLILHGSKLMPHCSSDR